MKVIQIREDAMDFPAINFPGIFALVSAGFFTSLAASELGASRLQCLILGGLAGVYVNYFFEFIK